MKTTIDNDTQGTLRSTIVELPVLGGVRAPALPLPVPPFPRHPEKCGNVEPDPKFLPRDGNPYRTRVTAPMVARALRGWLVPYLGSRVKPGDFHPIIAYLFTEWKCNLDCQYCWAWDNRVKGMTEELARTRSTGCTTPAAASWR